MESKYKNEIETTVTRKLSPCKHEHVSWIRYLTW